MQSARSIRLGIVTLAGALLILAVICFWDPFLNSALGLAAEDRAFARIQVGDAESQLVDILKSYDLEYFSQAEGDQTVYTHGDGFMGIYYYKVRNARVVEVGAD